MTDHLSEAGHYREGTFLIDARLNRYFSTKNMIIRKRKG
jgi:hypothetical protein